MTRAESDWIMVAGGVLDDAMYRLQKYQDDGCFSLWAGRTDDGPLIHQIAAATRALPLPNGKIRYARVVDLNDNGWRLDHTPCIGSVDPIATTMPCTWVRRSP